METSSRMRRCLRRNYKGSDHFGAAANYEDQIEIKHDKGNVPVLAAEAISVEGLNEDGERTEIENFDGRSFDTEQSGESQLSLSGATDQNMQPPAEPNDIQLARDQDLENASAVAPGYVPSELDERIILELPSSMVRPLTVMRGTFQVSSMRLAWHPFLIIHQILSLFHVFNLKFMMLVSYNFKWCYIKILKLGARNQKQRNLVSDEEHLEIEFNHLELPWFCPILEYRDAGNFK
jgi:hypothetical protein